MARRYGKGDHKLIELLKQSGYGVGIFRNRNSTLEISREPWGDVLAISPLGLELLQQRIPECQIIEA